MKNLANFAHCTCFLLFVLLVVVSGRQFPNSGYELVSDGVADDAQWKISSFLHLKGVDSSEEYCEQMYGILPCSNSLLGHLFLILVYEYLLFKGESLAIYGGSRVFEILGPGIFGASAFPIIGPLPESLILLASGLLNSKEIAQEYVLTGVGLLVGSTIFHLTLLWGSCVFFGKQRFSSLPGSDTSDSNTLEANRYKKWLSSLTGSGITIEPEASFTARIMLLSLIPFLIILIPEIFGASHSSIGNNIIMLVTLIISVLFLLAYFFYQYDSRIQERRLEYVGVEHRLLILDIIHHAEEHLSEKLLTPDGAPEVAIRRLFDEIDQDRDKHVSLSEIRKVFHGAKLSKLTWDREKVMEKMMKDLDLNGDSKITLEEFSDKFEQWLSEISHAINGQKRTDIQQVGHLLMEQKRKEQEMMEKLRKDIIKHLQSTTILKFFAEDGRPNESSIIDLFNSIDADKDGSISQTELKALIQKVDFGEITMDENDAVSLIMEDMDISGDRNIDLEEFIQGITKYNSASNALAAHKPMKELDRSLWSKAKATMILVIGIAILALLAEPLIHSVQRFSTTANIPSFYISFTLVPLASNARTAISAMKAAHKRRQHITTLTFSEIYDGVFMNNILGLVVLLSIIYFRGLIWQFSAELLVLVIVCAIMGLIAKFCIKGSLLDYVHSLPALSIISDLSLCS